MKNLFLCCSLLFLVFASCKKDTYIKNTEAVTDTVHLISTSQWDTYYLCDNTYLFLDATTPGALSYQWLPTNETSPVIEFRPNNYIPVNWNGWGMPYYGCYEVIVTMTDTTIRYKLGVKADESVVYCPNSFTPNGDGCNEYWMVGFDNRTVNLVSINIYDSQDAKVFTWKEGKDPAWNGKYNDIMCDAGYYYFIVHYTTAQGGKRSREGILQLIR